EKRAELRLVVNAGSVLEADDQLGLAHFCEHMAFNGTLHFQKHKLVDYLESIGMRFGPDLNAYTSFDETVYMLQIPTDQATIVDTAFQILVDWAAFVSFNDEEIEKERGVVIEEWRLGRGAAARMRDKQFPILFKNSRYATRLPIGSKAVLDTFHHETLRQFYQKWYRPDLMAVVAVGDFKKEEIERLIHEKFSQIPPPKTTIKRPLYPVPDHPGTLYAIATDKEATRSSVSIYFKRDVRDQSTEGAYRQMLVEALYNSMFNNRFEELLHQPDPPFLYAYSGQGRFVRTKEFYILGAAVKEGEIIRGLEAVLREAKRVKQFGFTSAELERQKQEFLRSMESAYQERDKTDSRQFAAEYIRNFLEQEPIPGIELEYQLYQKHIPTITLEEVNRLAEEFITDGNRVVLVSAPEKEGVNVPDEKQLAGVFDRVAKMVVEPYEEEVSDAPLLPRLPEPGTIISEEKISELGVVKWKLSNGITVLLKPTDFKNDELLFRAFSPGGNSLVADSDYIAALTADEIVTQGGIGDFDLVTLEKKLAGKEVTVSPWINSLFEGFRGSASPKDLETMFQLIYLYATAPRMDSTAFLSYKTRLKGMLENRFANPEVAFLDTLNVTLTQHHFRTRPWSLDMVEQLDLKKSFEIYRDRFADLGDFTFVFVGNIDLPTFRKFVARYLGSLPTQNRSETWKDVGIRYPTGVIKKEVFKGVEPKSQVRIVFTGPFEWNQKNRFLIRSLASVLNIKLREKLREDEGGTYGVGVWASPERYPVPDYSIHISFGCAPERVQELLQIVFQEIHRLKEMPVDDIYLQKVKETQRRKYEVDLKKNSYWAGALWYTSLLNEPPTQILNIPKLIEGLNKEDIQAAAQTYFNENNYVQVVLYPENFKAQK
ncbi:MAG: insulinase family protein, partial [Calditrichaeota bacterium]